jgi:hypothetical protein
MRRGSPWVGGYFEKGELSVGRAEHDDGGTTFHEFDHQRTTKNRPWNADRDPDNLDQAIQKSAVYGQSITLFPGCHALKKRPQPGLRALSLPCSE